MLRKCALQPKDRTNDHIRRSRQQCPRAISWIKQILKDRKADLDQTIEMRAKIDTYRKALGSLTDTPLGDWARSWMANEARTRRRDSPETDPQLDEFLKKRKQPTNDGEAA